MPIDDKKVKLIQDKIPITTTTTTTIIINRFDETATNDVIFKAILLQKIIPKLKYYHKLMFILFKKCIVNQIIFIWWDIFDFYWNIS
jgi:hypothetical protein